MVDLYSIFGMFNEKGIGSEVFAGYLLKDGDDQLTGKLIDCWGSSDIVNGALRSHNLSFVKTYGESNNGRTFDYCFVLKDGIWQGTYECLTESHIDGPAVCSVGMAVENFDQTKFSLKDAESMAQILLNKHK